MVNPPKIKGTKAESAFVTWLRANGFPYAERRSLAGTQDRGDVTGCPGLVFEVKDQLLWKLAPWMRETVLERQNARADFGILIIKPPGVGHTNPGNWVALMHQGEFRRLIGDELLTHWYEEIISPRHINRYRAIFAKQPGRVLTVIKAMGEVDTDLWYVACRVNELVELLRRRGYGQVVEDLPRTLDI